MKFFWVVVVGQSEDTCNSVLARQSTWCGNPKMLGMGCILWYPHCEVNCECSEFKVYLGIHIVRSISKCFEWRHGLVHTFELSGDSVKEG